MSGSPNIFTSASTITFLLTTHIGSSSSLPLIHINSYNPRIHLRRMVGLCYPAVFTIAFIKDSFGAAKFHTMSVIQSNSDIWMFPALMVISFLGALYLSIPPDQRSRFLRFQPRNTTDTASHEQSAPHTTPPSSQSIFGVEYKTPQPGPAFGHFLRKVRGVPNPNSRTSVNRQNMDLQSSQTPSPKLTPTSLFDPGYAELSRSAPTSYATLQQMGLLDDLGTPTKKLKDTQQKHKLGVTVNRLGDVRSKSGMGVRDDPFLIYEDDLA